MISVVVPVYNMEKYLSRCLDSLLAQTIEDFEILLIDDGSTDSSADICKEYTKKDHRIIYVYKENGGLSDTRNAAIKIAKGEYITFVDSDDYVHSTYLEYLLSLMERYNADIASCVHFETSDNACEFDLKEQDVICLNGKEACKRMLTDLAPVLTAACAKLYKTDLVKKYEFPYGRLHEDVATTYRYYFDAGNVVYGYRKLYAYYQHPNSIMHNISDKKVEDELWAMSDRALVLQQNGEKQLASQAWEFMAKFLKRDIVNEIGNSKIWKKYGKMYVQNASGMKAKIRGILMVYFSESVRCYVKKKNAVNK